MTSLNFASIPLLVCAVLSFVSNCLSAADPSIIRLDTDFNSTYFGNSSNATIRLFDSDRYHLDDGTNVISGTGSGTYYSYPARIRRTERIGNRIRLVCQQDNTADLWYRRTESPTGHYFSYDIGSSYPLVLEGVIGSSQLTCTTWMKLIRDQSGGNTRPLYKPFALAVGSPVKVQLTVDLLYGAVVGPDLATTRWSYRAHGHIDGRSTPSLGVSALVPPAGATVPTSILHVEAIVESPADNNFDAVRFALDALTPVTQSVFTRRDHASWTATGLFTGVPSGNHNLHASLRFNDAEVGSKQVAFNTIANTPPTAQADSYEGLQARNLHVQSDNGVLSNDSDANFDNFSAELVSSTSHGQLTLRADGSFDYYPAVAFTGTDTFTYRAVDAEGQSAITTVSLQIASRSGAKIGMHLTDNGTAKPPGATVEDTVEVTVTILDAIGQHAQFYANMMVAPTTEHGHMITSSPWVRTLRFDTRRFYDGANLFSVHVHPHNHHGNLSTEIEIGQFKVRSANANPAPNGDTELPEFDITLASANGSGGKGALIFVDGNLNDDGPTIDIDQRSFQSEGGQVICHLGSSVLGRHRWTGSNPPWGDGRLVDTTNVIAYQKDHEFPVTLVMFMSDEVGRANYAYADITLPPRPANIDPLPHADAKILNLHQGQEVVIPSGGSHTVQVKVTDPTAIMYQFKNLALWVGNRSVQTVDIQDYLDDYDAASNSVIIPMQIPSLEIRRLQEAREGGQSSTAFAVWADFTEGRFGNRPASEHIHLTSIRTSDYQYPAPEAHIAITSPAKNSQQEGNHITISYATAGPLPTDYRIAYQVDGGAWLFDADKDGVITANLDRGSHTAIVRITDSNGEPINTPSSSATVAFALVNAKPQAMADSYNAVPGTTLRIDATNGLLANDTDLENDALQASLSGTVSSGTLRLQADGSFELDVPANQRSMISWTTRVTDDQGGEDLAVTLIRITDSSGGSRIDTDWRMTGGNAEHHSYVPIISSDNPQQLWRNNFPTNINLLTRPATGSGKIFIGHGDTSANARSGLHAYQLGDGSPAWAITLPGRTRTVSDPCYHDGLVWIAGRLSTDDSGRLYAFNAQDGALVVSKVLHQRSHWRHSPTAYGDVITHPFYDGRMGLAAFRRSNGATLWQSQQSSTSTIGRWNASYCDGLWFGSVSGVFSSWNNTNGTVTPIDGSTNYDAFTNREMITPCAKGIVLQSTAEALIARDVATGTERWRLLGTVHCNPSIAGDLVFALIDDRILACNLNDGTRLINVQGPSNANTNDQMLVTDRHVFISSSSRVFMVDYLNDTILPEIVDNGYLAMADGKLIVARSSWSPALSAYSIIDNALPGVVIDTPAHDSTLAANQVQISYHLTAATPTNSRVAFSLNGSQVAIDDDGTLVLTGLSPGTHQLSAQVIDSNDQALGMPHAIRISTANNQAPIANADNYVTGQAQTLYIPANGLLANDADPDHGRLTAELISQTSNGHVILDSNGGFRYFPNGNYTGTDQFTYRCFDGDRYSSAATVSISVQARSGPKIAISITEDGEARNPEGSVDGMIEASVTIWDAIGQHAQFYTNMMVSPTVEHGHMITTSPWTRRALIDTTHLYDGANLISVHVHPHGHPHGHHTYTVDFEVASFMLRTSNNNPAPNGDTELPDMFIADDQFNTISSSVGGRVSGDVQLIDDTGPLDISQNSSVGGNATVVAHLGNSVLGRLRWNTLNPPFAEQRVVSFANLSYFQQDTERQARIVFFFTDEVGRANYAFRTITIPAFTDANRDFLPFPAADVQFLNLNQGDSVVIPDEGSFPLRLRIHHPQQAMHRYGELTVWVGNRSVKVINMADIIAEQGEGLHHYDITVDLPAREAEIMQNGRAGGLAATATPVWCDFTFGREDNLPTSNHIHLTSFRTASYEFPGQQPSIDVLSPSSGDSVTNRLKLDYITHGGLPANTGLAYRIDGGSKTTLTIGTSLTLPAMSIGDHSIDLWLEDEHGNPLSNAEASTNLTVTVQNTPPRPGLISRSVRFDTRLDQAAGTIINVAKDPDGQTLTCSLQSTATHGSVVVSSDGGFSYTPAPGYTGTDSFAYSLDDGHGGISIGTVILRVGADGGLHAIPANWETYGNGPQHSGSVLGSIGPEDLQLAWTKSYTHFLQPVVIGDGRVYVGPDSYHGTGNLEALNSQDGSLIWEHGFVRASSIDPPTFHDGKIYIARGNHSSDSQLWCLDAADHSTLWSSPYRIQWDRAYAPLVADGRVYMNGGYHGGMYGFDKDNGTELFWQDLDSWDEWTPAYDQGRLYSWVNGSFHEHDPSDGTIMDTVTVPWDWRGYSMNTVASIDRGYAVLVGTKGAHGIDLTTMQSRWWRHDTSTAGLQRPATALRSCCITKTAWTSWIC